MSRNERTMPRFLRYFISQDEFRLRAGWRLLAHSILFLFFLLLVAFLVFVVTSLLGLQPDDIFQQSSPVVEIAITLPVYTVVTFMVRRAIDRRSFQSLGFNLDSQTMRDLLAGFAISGIMMAGIFLFEWAVGWLTVREFAWEGSAPGNWLPDLTIWLIVYIAVGYQEELLSRGYHLQNLVDGLNLPLGILISSMIFAVLHIGNPSFAFASFLGLLAAGYFLAFAWVRTRQLWLPIGLHIGWNFFEGNVFGFPVSGTEPFKLIRHEISGPRLVTGGAFGPEAGLILLPALLLGTTLIYLYTSAQEGRKKTSPEGRSDHA